MSASSSSAVDVSGGFPVVTVPDESSPETHEHGLLPDLNGSIDLVMSLSPKSSQNINHRTAVEIATSEDLSSSDPTQQQAEEHLHLQQHNHHQQGQSHATAVALLQDHHSHHQLAPHHYHHHLHSTPFSVTDILSPIEESYRKLELAANPPSPYR